jgi:hypothetical protein
VQASSVDQCDIFWMNVVQGSSTNDVRVDQGKVDVMGSFDIATRGVKAAINSLAFTVGE